MTAEDALGAAMDVDIVERASQDGDVESAPGLHRPRVAGAAALSRRWLAEAQEGQ